MDKKETGVIQAAADRLIPPELVSRLHEANQRLHAARQALEQSVGSSGYGHQQEVNKAGDDLRAAEKAVEDVTLEIHKSIQARPDAP